MMSVAALSINNVSKTYKNGVEAVRDVSFRVDQGGFYALLGPNGAGKSTMIGMIATLINMTSGRVEVMGADIEKSARQAQAAIGVMPQEVNLNVFETCWSIMRSQASSYGIPYRDSKVYCAELLKKVSLWDKRGHQVRTLSGGMKRRLMLARAMVHRPDILILDEPTAGVDVEIRQSIWSFVKEMNQKGTTIILTTHYLEEAQSLCDRVAILDHGKMRIDAPIKELLSFLECELIELELATPVNPKISLDPLRYQWVAADRLHIDLPKDQTITDLIGILSAKGIVVSRVSSPKNRLEQLFLRLVNEKDTTQT